MKQQNQNPSSDSVATLLVPTDFSEPSFKALRYAAGLARLTGAALHVVHVAEIDFAVPGDALPDRNPLVDDTEEGRVLRQKLQALVEPGVVPVFHGRTGRAFDQIVRLASELEADLIVMSTLGRTGFKRLLFGSNAERVVQHSSCPVLVVRANQADLRVGEELRLRTIVVPIDFSASSEEALRIAVAFAQKVDARLVLLHAVVAPVVPLATGYAVPTLDVPLEQLRSAAADQMRALVDRTAFNGVAHEIQITTGFPGEAICAYADGRGADLIVMSSLGRTGLMHVLIGSVAEHVVWHALMPVMVVPGRMKTKRDEGAAASGV
jgi:nucleotide-binding universal stress UspA family protein